MSLSLTLVRHRRENTAKCSLTPLWHKGDYRCVRYPSDTFVTVAGEGGILLSHEGEPLQEADRTAMLWLVDGTWSLAQVMVRQMHKIGTFTPRSLPGAWHTAYPRKQTGCSAPQRGLASVEALFAVQLFFGIYAPEILANYYWKEPFFAQNAALIDAWRTTRRTV